MPAMWPSVVRAVDGSVEVHVIGFGATRDEARVSAAQQAVEAYPGVTFGPPAVADSCSD